MKKIIIIMATLMCLGAAARAAKKIDFLSPEDLKLLESIINNQPFTAQTASQVEYPEQKWTKQTSNNNQIWKNQTLAPKVKEHPLCKAIETISLAAIDMFCQARHMINTPRQSDGKTPLFLACEKQDTLIIRKLINAGADEYQEINGNPLQTPALYAIDNQLFKIIDIFYPS